MAVIRCIVFDLDDTLYTEWDFVSAGFGYVAKELEHLGFGRLEAIQKTLSDIHWKEGREHVFDKAAARLGFPVTLVPDLVRIYRGHPPSVQLAPDAIVVLDAFRARIMLGCVTDGIADVQRRKVEALGLSHWIEGIIFTDDLGREFWKPHPRSIEMLCGRFGVRPDETVFVGDNPKRDSKAARNAGVRSVRIRRPGGYFSQMSESADMADYNIASLTELLGLVDMKDKAWKQIGRM